MTENDAHNKTRIMLNDIYTHEYLRGTNYNNLIYTVKTNLPITCPVCSYDVIVLDTQGE